MSRMLIGWADKLRSHGIQSQFIIYYNGCKQQKSKLTHQDFNGSPGNLGWDSQGLEERCLLRSETRVSLWDKHINRGKGSSLGRGSHLVGQDGITNRDQIILGKHKPNVSLDVWKEPGGFEKTILIRLLMS